jgi:hypothetical protein
MGRWVLVYQGAAPIPEADAQAVRDLPVQIIDQAGRSILVEGDGKELRPAVEKLADWKLTAETRQIRKPPQPRKRIKRKLDES